MLESLMAVEMAALMDDKKGASRVVSMVGLRVDTKVEMVANLVALRDVILAGRMVVSLVVLMVVSLVVLMGARLVVWMAAWMAAMRVAKWDMLNKYDH